MSRPLGRGNLVGTLDIQAGRGGQAGGFVNFVHGSRQVLWP